MMPALQQVDLDDLLRHVHVVALPMHVRFRGVTEREIALIEGPSGWGEFSPFLEYGPPETARWLAGALESAYASWPVPVRDLVPVNATIPAVPASQVAAILDRFPGAETVKVKVAEAGQSLADDLDRVAAVRSLAGDRARIRVDANGAWDLDTASDALGRLAAYELDYAEQPCAEVDDLAQLRTILARRGIAVRIAADESIRRSEDPMLVARRGAADVIVVKVAPLGGVAAALAIVAESGLPAVVSSALDSSVGISAGVALAAALPDLDGACGLGTLALMDGDVTDQPMSPAGGVLAPRRVPVQAHLLQRYAVAPPRLAVWHARIRDAYACLARNVR